MFGPCLARLGFVWASSGPCLGRLCLGQGHRLGECLARLGHVWVMSGCLGHVWASAWAVWRMSAGGPLDPGRRVAADAPRVRLRRQPEVLGSWLSLAGACAPPQRRIEQAQGGHVQQNVFVFWLPAERPPERRWAAARARRDAAHLDSGRERAAAAIRAAGAHTRVCKKGSAVQPR
jgi:hypothetical protein